MTGVIKGGRAKSIDALRKSTARPSGDDTYLQRIGADDSVMARFLTEPTEWQEYFEHYDAVMRYYPCTEGQCPGCSEGDKPSKKYLANVLLPDEGKVVPMVLPKSLVTRLLTSYDRYGTMMDRPYELIRIGSGLDTDYDRNPESPSKLNTKRYTLLDLEKVLIGQLTRGRAEAGIEEEAEEAPAHVAPTKVAKRVGKNVAPVMEDAEDEDDEDEDEATDTALTREELESMSLRELRAHAKGDRGFSAVAVRGLDTEELVALILGESDEDEDEDEDTEEPETEDADEDEEEADEDEDDEEGLTEDEVRALDKAELQEVLKSINIPFRLAEGKNSLLKKVLTFMAEGEEDEEEDPDLAPF